MKDGRLIFIIADVSGKGTGAALLASNILASFRILYNTPDFNLVDATIMVSDQLLRHSFSGNFATLFIGYLDTANDMLHFVNAGHNPPMIIRTNGSVDHLESSGIPIGIFDMHDWKEETTHFEPGDFLYAYTDGVTEAENSGGEQYGEERQMKLLLGHKDMPLDQLPFKLTSEIENFLGGLAPQSCDDITMLVIKREY